MANLKFTSASTEEIVSKINIFKLLKKELDSIEILDYSDLLNGILIIFQAFPANHPSQKVKEYQVLRRKTKTLELYLVLDYDKIMAGTDTENLIYIKDVFLKGCETYLKPLKDFKYPEFIASIKELV